MDQQLFSSYRIQKAQADPTKAEERQEGKPEKCQDAIFRLDRGRKTVLPFR